MVLACLVPRPVEAIAPVQGQGEWIQPPYEIATKFKTLIDRFKSEKSGFGCILPIGGGEEANCLLILRCSMNVVLIHGAVVQRFGMIFFDPDDRCATTYFFSQIQSMLELFEGISTERAREIVDAMDRDEGAYGTCNPDKLGNFPEGSGGMSYGREGRTHYRGDTGKPVSAEEIVKIFCWAGKKS